MGFKVPAASVLLALVLAGCNTVQTRTTKVNTPVVIHAYGHYDHHCLTWEPPEASLWTAPAHGTVTYSLEKGALGPAGFGCTGKKIDYRVSIYKPAPGFRGQDKLTLKYDSITDDAGGRATRTFDFIIDVK